MIRIIDHPLLYGAAVFEKAPVEFDDFRAARPLVQAIDVLRHQGEPPYAFRQAGQRVMSRIRHSFGNQLTTPAIPAPDQRRIAFECLGGCKFERIVLRPQAGLRVAERRHATFRGDAGTGKDADSPAIA